PLLLPARDGAGRRHAPRASRDRDSACVGSRARFTRVPSPHWSAGMLTPLGTLRSRFGQPAPGPSFSATLAAELDCERDLYLAWGLARLADVPDGDRDDLANIVMALRLAMREGSTRLALPDLPRLLARFGVQKPVTLPEGLFGLPGAPLVVDGAHLYSRRSH